jgi:2-isopropylmalate synthase
VRTHGDEESVISYLSHDEAGPLSRANMGAIQSSGEVVALIDDGRTAAANDRIRITALRVVSEIGAPKTAALTLEIDGEEVTTTATGDGPVDAVYGAIDSLVAHQAVLKLYNVNAVTDGIDAQATVSVRLEEDGKIVQGHSADTDTILASARAYVIALNKLVVRRGKNAPNETISLAS